MKKKEKVIDNEELINAIEGQSGSTGGAEGGIKKGGLLGGLMSGIGKLGKGLAKPLKGLFGFLGSVSKYLHLSVDFFSNQLSGWLVVLQELLPPITFISKMFLGLAGFIDWGIGMFLWHDV